MDKHLEGLTLVEKRLVRNYAILVRAELYDINVDVPEKLRPYVEIEMVLQEMENQKGV